MKQSTALIESQGPVVANTKLTTIFVAAKPDFSVDGLLRILSDNSENKIVTCANPDKWCWDELRSAQPEILLIHHHVVTLPVADFFARVKDTVPGINIIVFGQGMDDVFLRSIVRDGAAGYINENMSSHNLLEAIQKVMEGKLWVERRILEILAYAAIDMERTLENSILERIDAVRKVLSKRETAVFRLVLEGLATKDIAKKMELSEQSVKLYLSRIFKKFNVTNRSQLILYAFARICPVSNVFRLIRMTLDKRRLEKGQPPLINDPLDSSSC